jgi:hypothetical protein
MVAIIILNIKPENNIVLSNNIPNRGIKLILDNIVDKIR